MTLWYLARALGFVALIAFTASTSLGLLATSSRRGRQKTERRLVRQLVHRSVAVIGLLALGLHAAAVVADSYVDVSLPSTLVPFTAGYRPLAVGLGTLALWVFVLTAVSGAMRGRLAGWSAGGVSSRAWRVVHRVAYVGWALSMGHGLLAGTDTRTPWALATYALCAVAVGGTAVRVLATRTPRRRPALAGHRRLITHGGA